MSGAGDSGGVVGRATVWAGDPKAAGERFGPDRVGGDGVSAAEPVEGAGAGAQRVGGVGGRVSTEILCADGGRETPGAGDGGDLVAIFAEHEEAASSNGQGGSIGQGGSMNGGPMARAGPTRRTRPYLN